MALLELAWLQAPDQRLGQLLHNLNPRTGGDAFYVEDDEWEAALRDWIVEP